MDGVKEIVSVTTKDRARIKIERDLGVVLLDALNDPKTVEIMLNADGRVWQEKLGEGVTFLGDMEASRGEAIIKAVAGYHSKEITRHKPFVEGELPIDGSRFAGQLPPIVKAPTFAIRKKAVSVFKLDEYVESKILSFAHYSALKSAVENHRNILVVGGTGSGKTTFVNALIEQMVITDPSERVFIIEDTGEIQCNAINHVQYHTTLDVSMTDLLKTTLRMRPDRILVGEVRGAEALDLLMAWNTGHEGGAATLHSNTALSGLSRLEMLVSMNRDAPKNIAPLIAETVDVVVHIEKTPEGRRVREVVEVCGYTDGQYITKTIKSEGS